MNPATENQLHLNSASVLVKVKATSNTQSSLNNEPPPEYAEGTALLPLHRRRRVTVNDNDNVYVRKAFNWLLLFAVIIGVVIIILLCTLDFGSAASTPNNSTNNTQ